MVYDIDETGKRSLKLVSSRPGFVLNRGHVLSSIEDEIKYIVPYKCVLRLHTKINFDHGEPPLSGCFRCLNLNAHAKSMMEL